MLSPGLRERALVEAGIALNSELSLAAVLGRLTELASELTGARYAALGVIDGSGAALESFTTHGVGPDVHEAIGREPRGRGILGVLIHEAEPLRLHDLHSDPRSVGFPPGHPEMRTFLGVPVKLRDVAYGNLYLTEKAGGCDFTEEDEAVLTLLAAQAAVAIENARLYEAATRWSHELESVNELMTAVAGEVELPRVLDLVVTRLRELLHAGVVSVVLRESGTELRIAASSDPDLLGVRLSHGSKSEQVLERGVSERADRLGEDPAAAPELAARLGVESAIFVPLVAGGKALGVAIAADKAGETPRFDDDDLRLTESFARRAAVAVELSERVARDALRRVVRAQEQERRRLARELHDETGGALTSILLGLRAAEDAPDADGQRQALERLRELVVTTLQDVRRLAVELRPKALDDFGLVPALERLAESFREGSGLELQVESRLGEDRLAGEVETAVYRIVQEALTNVLKHAEAEHVSIVVTRKNGWVYVVIEDDGRGFDPQQVGVDLLGLTGMRERVGLLDGTLVVESARGRGTTLVVSVPA
jgi:signal transduction histidine kinase